MGLLSEITSFEQTLANQDFLVEFFKANQEALPGHVQLVLHQGEVPSLLAYIV